MSLLNKDLLDNRRLSTSFCDTASTHRAGAEARYVPECDNIPAVLLTVSFGARSHPEIVDRTSANERTFRERSSRTFRQNSMSISDVTGYNLKPVGKNRNPILPANQNRLRDLRAGAAR